MPRLLLPSLLLLTAVLCAAALSDPRPAEDPADVLRESDRAFFRATREKGLEGWLGWFADDAVVFPPSGALAVGRDEVRRHYASLGGFPPRGFLWDPEEAGLATSGDLGWTIGRAGNDASGTPVWTGRYLTVWRKQPDGAWRVVSDCSFDPRYAAVLPGLSEPPTTVGREREHRFASASGELSACLGSWWAADAEGSEAGGKYLALWRKNADGSQELVTETGILQARR